MRQRYEDRTGFTLIDLPNDEAGQLQCNVRVDRISMEPLEDFTEMTLNGRSTTYDELVVILGSHQAADEAWADGVDVAVYG